VAGGLAIIALVTVYMLTSQFATVPDLTGHDEAAASQQLTQRRLNMEVSQRLYSGRPKGTILSQLPRAGLRIRKGAAVTVSVSGGTELVAVPNLFGMTQQAARDKLSQLGLVASSVSQVSREKPGTVTSTSPVAGINLKVGDTVVLHVACATEVISLVDYQLAGQTVVIEPHYSDKYKDFDVTYDVAQRLSALIKAAGGTAVITRSSSETNVSAQTFDTRARDAHPTAMVIIQLDGVNSSALAVLAQQQDGSLGQALFEQMRRVSASAIFSDTAVVSAASASRSAAVSLGMTSSPADRALFADDLFCDGVARAMYMGIGKALTH